MDEFLIITPMKNTDLYLYHCGISSCSPGHFFGPGIADHYIIHYVIDGYGTLNVNNECYSLKKGNFFLQEPNVLTHYKADYNDPWTYCWVAFNGLKAKEYIASIGVTHDNPISSYCHGDALVNCIHQMTTYEGSPKSKTIGLMGLLYTFLSLLIENSSQNSSITTEGNKQYIDSAINFIKMNYSRKVLISDLAAYVGLERSYFSTLFKEYLKISPQEFLINYRINIACQLMSTTNLTVNQISHSVGYSDPYLFSKTFKKIKGITPKNYKKSLISL